MKISSLTLCAAALCCGLTAVSGEISMRLAASAPEKKAVNDFLVKYRFLCFITPTYPNKDKLAFYLFLN